MAEQLIKNVETRDDYNTLIETGNYEESGLTVEVYGDTYTPSISDTDAIVNGLYKYRFTGYDSGPLEDLNGETDTFAKYELIEHTVTFNSLYNTPPSQTIVHGEYAIKPDTPQAPSTDYGVFYAWYTNTDYETLFNFEQTAITEDIILYARWIPSAVLFESQEDGSTISLNNISSKQVLYYSDNGGESWNDFTPSVTITIDNGESVYIRGILSGDNTESDYTNFNIQGKIAVSGNCNSLWNYMNPDAPLYRYCGCNLFYNCTDLVEIKEKSNSDNTLPSFLPATTLAYGCYESMFAGCTSLVTAPELPAERMWTMAYYNMFDYCTSLTTAPILPATTLAVKCYAYMFDNCTNLTTAPVLPATTLAGGCYRYMFAGCTSLTTAPELPATILTDGCYERMFRNCSNLNYIKCLATDISATHCTEHWVLNVASTGTFIKADEMTVDDESGWTVDNISGIPPGWYLTDEKYNIPYIKFTSLENGSTIGLAHLSPYQTLEYSLDNETWNNFTITDTITLNDTKEVYFRGILTGDNQYYNATNFNIAGKVLVSGNINSLWNYENLGQDLFDYCGFGLFRDCAGLVDASGLAIPTANSRSCYEEMFERCLNLRTAPELLSTTLGAYCYYDMFWGCTSLTTAPTLPAITLADNCYDGMFQNCTSLTTAPELPATTLATECYHYMFCGCTSLTTAPELPATTLADGCYNSMFQGCTSLITAPELPATTLADYCYESMFQNCTSLTTAPELLTETLFLESYRYMFQNCTSLNYIKCLATDISAEDCTSDWVNNVAPSGTFIKATGMNDWLIDSPNGIPEGWTAYNESDLTNAYITFTSNANNSTIKLYSLNTEKQKLWYSYDPTDVSGWTEFTTIDNITLNSDDNLYVRGKLTGNNTENKYTQFSIGGNVSVSGNINAIWDYENLFASLREYCGYNLFNNCTGLTDASNLVFSAASLAKCCYFQMFANCRNLITSPEILPAMDLSNAPSGYTSMFQYCRSLTTAPELPATKLANSCYESMFHGCVALETAPDLPASSLTDYCYYNMFFGDSNLTTVPEILPATALTRYCYCGMFYGCSSLATAPKLPATKLDFLCYSSMFGACSNLISAPEILPATALSSYCYEQMFRYCTSLTTAPILPATTLASYCYQSMFNGCTSLNYIKCLAVNGININGNANTKNWVNNVAPTGTFVKETGVNDWPIDSPNGIPEGWTVQEYSENENNVIFTILSVDSEAENGVIVSLPNKSTNQQIEYSINNTYQWVTLNGGDTIPNLKQGDKVFFRGKLTGDNTNNDYTQFAVEDGTFAVSGNINALWNYENLNQGLHEDCGRYLFKNCVHLIDASELTIPSADNLASCIQMFYGCTSLLTPPKLLATTLSEYSYEYMFQGCTSLRSVPSNMLPASIARPYCYSQMFRGCTSLTTVPELPATTLTQGCYEGMFNGCTSLETAPELPATTLAEYCYYQMFYNCTKLASVPVGMLPATTLAPYCYNSMFWNCTSLENTPILPATRLSLNCYENMFCLCKKLTSVPSLPATVLSEQCYQSMFASCKGLTTVPADLLPATTLKLACYKGMFGACSNLRAAPILPATALTSECYDHMFINCESLTYVKCLATTNIGVNDSTNLWMLYVSPTGTFIKDPSVSDQTWRNTGIPNGWTITPAT